MPVPKVYDWTEDAIKAIRQHFRDRNAAKGKPNKRVVLHKRFVELDANGDMIYRYTYGGETVTMTRKAYTTVVDFG